MSALAVSGIILRGVRRFLLIAAGFLLLCLSVSGLCLFCLFSADMILCPGFAVKDDKENGSRLEERADTYMTSMYSGSDLKNMSDEIKKVREAFVASQTVDIVDPLNASKEIDAISNKLDAFMADVDSQLSVSNALTTIEVEYETY